MIDWILDNIGWFLLAAFVAIFALMIYAVNCSVVRRNALMAECLADGRKEYECYSMLKSNSHSTVVPMIVPVGR